MNNKKLIIIVIAAVMSGLLIWKFSNNNSKQESKVKITILGENSATMQSMMGLKKDYETTHPNIDLDFKPNTFDDAFSKSNQDFANKTGLYDLVIQYNFTLSSSVRNKYVYLIDELTADFPKESKQFESDIFPALWQEIGFYYKDATDPSKGTVRVGYPSAGLTMLLMYNKAMFENETNKASYEKKYHKALVVPTTWEDFRNVAEFFTDKQKQTYGVCLEGATGGFLYYEWTNFLFGMNGRVMDKDKGWYGDENTKVLLNSPEALSALSYHKSLKPFNAGNFSDVEQFQQMKLMKEGKIAMSIVWSDMIYPAIKTENGFDKKYGFAPVPGNKSILGGGAYFINRQTKHTKETTNYVIDLMQPSTQIKLAKMGLCSPLKSVYSDPGVKELPYSEALKMSLERGGIGLEAGPDANIVSEIITTYIQKVWNDELTPEQALAKAQSEIEIKRKEIFENLKKH